MENSTLNIAEIEETSSLATVNYLLSLGWRLVNTSADEDGDFNYLIGRDDRTEAPARRLFTLSHRSGECVREVLAVDEKHARMVHEHVYRGSSQYGWSVAEAEATAV